MIALFFGFIGAVGVWYTGTHYLGLSLFEVAALIAVTPLAALISLLLITTGESIPTIKKSLLNGIIMTWCALIALCVGQLSLMIPAFRDLKVIATLFIPLALCCGLSFPLFGMIRDRIVEKQQRAARLKVK